MKLNKSRLMSLFLQMTMLLALGLQSGPACFDPGVEDATVELRDQLSPLLAATSAEFCFAWTAVDATWSDEAAYEIACDDSPSVQTRRVGPGADTYSTLLRENTQMVISLMNEGGFALVGRFACFEFAEDCDIAHVYAFRRAALASDDPAAFAISMDHLKDPRLTQGNAHTLYLLEDGATGLEPHDGSRMSFERELAEDGYIHVQALPYDSSLAALDLYRKNP